MDKEFRLRHSEYDTHYMFRNQHPDRRSNVKWVNDMIAKGYQWRKIKPGMSETEIIYGSRLKAIK